MIKKLVTTSNKVISMFISGERNPFFQIMNMYKKPTPFSKIPYHEQYECRDFTVKNKK